MRSRFSEFRRRLRCSVSGVTSRWIFGALECVLPLLSFTCSSREPPCCQHNICKGICERVKPYVNSIRGVQTVTWEQQDLR